MAHSRVLYDVIIDAPLMQKPVIYGPPITENHLQEWQRTRDMDSFLPKIIISVLAATHGLHENFLEVIWIMRTTISFNGGGIKPAI